MPGGKLSAFDFRANTQPRFVYSSCLPLGLMRSFALELIGKSARAKSELVLPLKSGPT